MADRVTFRPVSLGKSLIDDRNKVSTPVFGLVPYSAVEQRDFESSEVLGAHKRNGCKFFLRGLSVKDFEWSLYSAEGRRGRDSPVGYCHGDDALNGSNTLAKLIDISCTFNLVLLQISLHRDTDNYDVVGVVSELGGRNLQEARDRSSCCAEQHECEGDLATYKEVKCALAGVYASLT